MIPISRSFRVLTPDNTVQKHRMPPVKNVRRGAKYSHLITWKGKLLVVWFVRVKGGWELQQP